MLYSQIRRTYNSDDCTSTGLLIRSNRSTVSITFRTCWQGSRERTWILRGCTDGHGEAKAIETHAKVYGTHDTLEAWGLTDSNVDRLGPVIR